eukprot:ANDGO_04091.mRNA.1 hypothetical protein
MSQKTSSLPLQSGATRDVPLKRKSEPTSLSVPVPKRKRGASVPSISSSSQTSSAESGRTPVKGRGHEVSHTSLSHSSGSHARLSDASDHHGTAFSRPDCITQFRSFSEPHASIPQQQQQHLLLQNSSNSSNFRPHYSHTQYPTLVCDNINADPQHPHNHRRHNHRHHSAGISPSFPNGGPALHGRDLPAWNLRYRVSDDGSPATQNSVYIPESPSLRPHYIDPSLSKSAVSLSNPSGSGSSSGVDNSIRAWFASCPTEYCPTSSHSASSQHLPLPPISIVVGARTSSMSHSASNGSTGKGSTHLASSPDASAAAYYASTSTPAMSNMMLACVPPKVASVHTPLSSASESQASTHLSAPYSAYGSSVNYNPWAMPIAAPAYSSRSGSGSALGEANLFNAPSHFPPGHVEPRNNPFPPAPPLPFLSSSSSSLPSVSSSSSHLCPYLPSTAHVATTRSRSREEMEYAGHLAPEKSASHHQMSYAGAVVPPISGYCEYPIPGQHHSFYSNASFCRDPVANVKNTVSGSQQMMSTPDALDASFHANWTSCLQNSVPSGPVESKVHDVPVVQPNLNRKFTIVDNTAEATDSFGGGIVIEDHTNEFLADSNGPVRDESGNIVFQWHVVDASSMPPP